jgi:hypothetical protein
VSADRAEYEARQAALLRALHSGQPDLDGFDSDDVAAASRSLLLKRMRAAAGSWPALANSLGPAFADQFERFARTTPPPRVGDGLADGLAFATTLDRHALTAHARAELLLARGLFGVRNGRVIPRRWPFLAVAVLPEPRRLLVVIHLPGLGRRHASVRLHQQP